MTQRFQVFYIFHAPKLRIGQVAAAAVVGGRWAGGGRWAAGGERGAMVAAGGGWRSECGRVRVAGGRRRAGERFFNWRVSFYY